jgi:hypothetical protein
MNEYEQIRKSLAKIRLLKEEVETLNLNQNSNNTNKGGEEIRFDGINTVGFFNSQESIPDQVKNDLTTSIGEFIKASGLLLDTLMINVEDSRIMMSTETVKNPGTDFIKSIVFDTNEDDPKIQVIGGTISLSLDIVNLIQLISKTYNDNQIGRNKLVSITQGSIE